MNKYTFPFVLHFLVKFSSCFSSIIFLYIVTRKAVNGMQSVYRKIMLFKKKRAIGTHIKEEWDEVGEQKKIFEEKKQNCKRKVQNMLKRIKRGRKMAYKIQHQQFLLKSKEKNEWIEEENLFLYNIFSILLKFDTTIKRNSMNKMERREKRDAAQNVIIINT